MWARVIPVAWTPIVLDDRPVDEHIAQRDEDVPP